MVQKPYDHDGDLTLNKFFGRLDKVFEETIERSIHVNWLLRNDKLYPPIPSR